MSNKKEKQNMKVKYLELITKLFKCFYVYLNRCPIVGEPN